MEEGEKVTGLGLARERERTEYDLGGRGKEVGCQGRGWIFKIWKREREVGLGREGYMSKNRGGKRMCA